MDDKTEAKQVARELFILSLISLYLELLIIRWMSSDISAFGVFKTFPLVTCFVGLGLGFAQPVDNAFRYVALALLQFVAVLKIADTFNISTLVFPSVGTFAWQHLEVFGENLWVYVFLYILLLIIILLGPFSTMLALGSRLGALFNKLSPLNAYCINIAGSIAGSLLFAIASFADLSPWLLLIPAAATIFIYLQRSGARIWMNLIPLLLCVGVASIGEIRSNDFGIYWSPYQRLDVEAIDVQPTGTTPDHGQPVRAGIVIGTNRYFYQFALDLSDAMLKRTDLPAGDAARLRENQLNYNLPYKLKKAKDVLVLGAGSGNDVAAALRNGAEHVDAIDIDPIIIQMGRRHHPEHPYDSDKVSIFCDDARHYLLHCSKTYDLVIFAGLDSHAVTGQGASVRIDNYVYTVESMREALKLLKPDGLMVLSFCKSRSWLSSRLYATVREASGYDPIVLIDQSKPSLQWELFLSGPLVQHKEVAITKDLLPMALEESPLKTEPRYRILTDDWPFVYVTPYVLDVPYLAVVLSILLLSTFAARRSLFSARDPRLWQMFFLGAAFLLLELQSIARLALLYGSTWLTSSIVINGVLVMILLANLLTIKLSSPIAKRQGLVYSFLFLSLLVSYALPVNAVLSAVPLGGRAIVTVLTLAPMFVAGIIFATSFACVANAGQALAFNLFGAVVGATLEYLSNYIGVSGLVLVALILYFCSFVSFKLIKRLPSEPDS